MDPFHPPGFLTFGLLSLVFLLALAFLPRYTSRVTSTFIVTALSVLPTMIGFIWVYRVFFSTVNYSGPGDPHACITNILNTTLYGIILSFVMLVISAFHTFWPQKRSA